MPQDVRLVWIREPLVPALLTFLALTAARLVFLVPSRLEEGRTAPRTHTYTVQWIMTHRRKTDFFRTFSHMMRIIVRPDLE